MPTTNFPWSSTFRQLIPPLQTFVGVPQYPAYRSATNFAFPDSFIPERWLQPDDALFAPTASDPHFDRDTFAADARAVLQPFSVGPRNCIGRFLAHAEMRLILARLIWCFDIEMPRTDEPEKRATIEKPWDCQRTYALWERKPKWVRMRPVTRDRKM